MQGSYKGPSSIFARSTSKLSSTNQQLGYAMPKFKPSSDANLALLATRTNDYKSGSAEFEMSDDDLQIYSSSKTCERLPKNSNRGNRTAAISGRRTTTPLDGAMSKTLLNNINTSSHEELDKLQDLKEIKVMGQSQFLREVNHQKRIPRHERVCEMNKLQENEKTGERDNIFDRHCMTDHVLIEHCSPRQFF